MANNQGASTAYTGKHQTAAAARKREPSKIRHGPERLGENASIALKRPEFWFAMSAQEEG